MNIELTEDERRALADALRVAADQYRHDAQTYAEYAEQRPKGSALHRIRDQFLKQTRECEALLKKIEELS